MRDSDFRSGWSKRDKFFDGAGSSSGQATPTRHKPENIPKPSKVLRVTSANVIDSAHYGYVYSMAMLPCSLEGAEDDEGKNRENTLLVTGSGDESVKVFGFLLMVPERL